VNSTSDVFDIEAAKLKRLREERTNAIASAGPRGAVVQSAVDTRVRWPGSGRSGLCFATAGEAKAEAASARLDASPHRAIGTCLLSLAIVVFVTLEDRRSGWSISADLITLARVVLVAGEDRWIDGRRIGFIRRLEFGGVAFQACEIEELDDFT
jgi:hypothetical protein